MLTKLCLMAVAALGALGAAFVGEAASATAAALDAATVARVMESPSVRTTLLRQAAERLSASWARPTQWHAGAAEALSAVFLMRAQYEQNADLLDVSGEWAERAVTLAPVQPHAWTRLAYLDEVGHGARICDTAACLAQSWTVAPMADRETACARLQIAARRGMLIPNDVRIVWYLASKPPVREAARCLSFLPPEQLFRALLAT